MKSVTRLGLSVSTTPIMAMSCRQCLPLSAVQLKSKHCRKPYCHRAFGHGQRVWCCWLSKTKCGLFDLVCSWKVCTNNLPPCSWNLVYDSSLQSPLNVKFVNSYCEIRVNSKIFCPHCVQSLATPCRYNSTIVGK